MNFTFKKILIVFALAIIPYNVYTAKANELELTPEDLPAKYSLGDQFGSYTIHSKSFFEMPSMQGVLPKPVKRSYQSLLLNNKPIGSVLYFQYKKGEDLSEVVSFLKGMLWSVHMGPSQTYPEELYVYENIIIIFSFSYQSQESDFLINIFQKKTGVNFRNESHNLENFTTKEYAIQGVGKVILPIPNNFKDEFAKAEPENPATLSLGIPDSKKFSVSLTFYSTAENENLYNGDNIWGILHKYGKQFLKNSVEKDIEIKELKGILRSGYYYMLTDKNLADTEVPEGKYRYFFQGAIRTGEVLVFFTIMSQDELDTANIKDLMNMLRLARQTP